MSRTNVRVSPTSSSGATLLALFALLLPLGACKSSATNCGASGAACCNASACNVGLVCEAAVCVADCGNLNEPCCNGVACYSGLTCQSDQCLTGTDQENDGGNTDETFDGGTSPFDGGFTQGNCAPGDVAEIATTCVCEVFSDCEAGNNATWACSNAHTCVQTCTSAADCTAPNVVCQNALCLPPFCGSDSECSSGQQCISGSCVASLTASNVSRCLVAPASGVLNSGGARTFWVVALDANGKELNYEGSVTWSTNSARLTATSSPSSPSTATVSGTTTGVEQDSVRATIGDTTCAPAALTAYPPQTAGTLRVTVIDEHLGGPLTGAIVVDGGGNLLTSGNDGTWSETNPNPGGRNTVSVFLSGFSNVTIVDTEATDILVPLESGATGTFTGTLTDIDFNNLSIPTGTVHESYSAASLVGNLMDSSLTAQLAQTVPTMINLGGTTATNVNEPEGFAVGLGPTMFKGTVTLPAIPGVRALWTMGGNLTLQTVLNAVSMETGGTDDVGAVLDAVLPVLGLLEVGVTGGVSVASGEDGTLSTSGTTHGPQAHLALDTLLRLSLSAILPDLPSYYLPSDVAGTPSGQLDSALVTLGVLARPQGFVPLGLTAGVNDAANNKADQVAGFMGGPDGVLPMSSAPRTGGLEGSPYLGVAVATNSCSLDLLVGMLGGLGFVGSASCDPSIPLAWSENLVLPGELTFNNQSVNSVAFPGNGAAPPSFLGIPVQPTLKVETRQLALAAVDIPGVAYHRLDIGTPGSGWHVYFPAGETLVTVPALPATFSGTDPLTTTTPIRLQSVTLNLNGDGASVTYTYDGVVSFQQAGGSQPTLDDLTLQIDQFSWLQLQ